MHMAVTPFLLKITSKQNASRNKLPPACKLRVKTKVKILFPLKKNEGCEIPKITVKTKKMFARSNH